MPSQLRFHLRALMRGAGPRGLAAALAFGLAACAPVERPPPPPDLPALVDRLPETVAAFARGATLPAADGREVGYATPGPIGAAATVTLGEPEPTAAPGPDAVALATLTADATRPTPPRRLAVAQRFDLPAAGPPVLACAAIAGRLGRERVEQLLCAGRIGGAPVRLHVAMPARDPPVADAAAFATAIAAALGGT